MPTGKPIKPHKYCTKCINITQSIDRTPRLERILANNPNIRQKFSRFKQNPTQIPTNTDRRTLNNELQIINSENTIKQMIKRRKLDMPRHIPQNTANHTISTQIIRNIIHTMKLNTTVTDPLKNTQTHAAKEETKYTKICTCTKITKQLSLPTTQLYIKDAITSSQNTTS